MTIEKTTGANKTDAGNGSNDICRVIDASRSPSPDPRRSPDMKKPIAILVAGHSNWGKSATLKALTEGRLFRSYQFSGADFFIRRMSNDDYTEGYKNFIDECVMAPTGNILAAFCPHFETGDLRFTEHSLMQLQTNYDLYIFVLKHQYHSNNRITDEELASLSGYGHVRIFDDRNAEAEARSVALGNYIAAIVRRTVSKPKTKKANRVPGTD